MCIISKMNKQEYQHPIKKELIVEDKKQENFELLGQKEKCNSELLGGSISNSHDLQYGFTYSTRHSSTWHLL